MEILITFEDLLQVSAREEADFLYLELLGDDLFVYEETQKSASIGISFLVELPKQVEDSDFN